MVPSDERPTPQAIASTLVEAIRRVEDPAAVIVMVGRALDAILELYGISLEQVRSGRCLPLRRKDFDRQDRYLERRA